MDKVTGPSSGKTKLTMTGLRLSGTVSILIDTVVCDYVIEESTDTKIVCTTGNKD